MSSCVKYKSVSSFFKLDLHKNAQEAAEPDEPKDVDQDVDEVEDDNEPQENAQKY